jgi:hypothetical protein
MQNQFVMDFLKMRQNLHKKPEVKAKSYKEVSDDIETTLATIIEKKPPAKDVVEYFKTLVKKMQEEEDNK